MTITSEHRGIAFTVRSHWFALTAGFICFLWALLGWFTVVPNQDILADGIQAQSLISDPRLVLSFPGQKHGGPLEYPFTILAEWLAPGNYFANAAVRPFLAFVTGFLVAQLFLRLFPAAPRWAFLTAMAVGPTIIHGLLGPEGNPVGVWWLQPNWDVAWLAVTAGALVFVSSRNAKHWRSLIAGLLVGLGLFAHPAISLLIVPLVALVALRYPPSISRLALAAAGFVVGVIPAGVSYVINARINTWDPSHGAFIAVDYYRDMGSAVLGLNGIPDYMFALLPFSLGLAPSDHFLNGPMKSVLMWMFVIAVLVSAVVATTRAVRQRRTMSPGGAVAVSWLVAIITFFAFITFIDPVWIYSSGLAILYWLSIGALPSFFATRWMGNTLTGLLITITGISTITHNANFYADPLARFETKVAVMNEKYEISAALIESGAQAVFGSYYDAVPVGYASGMQLRTLTSRYNRFPLTESELMEPTIRIGINSKPNELWGEESLALMDQCSPATASNALAQTDFRVFECPPSVLDIRR